MPTSTRVKAVSAASLIASVLWMLSVGPATAVVTLGEPIDLAPGGNWNTETWQVQFSPAHPGTLAYAVKDQQSDVAIINPTDGTVDGTISVGCGPAAIAFTPDGTEAYVANACGDSVSIIDASSNTVSETVTVPGEPDDVAMSPDGDFAIFSCYGDNTIKVMSTETRSIVKTYSLKKSGVWEARFTPDGSKIYALANKQAAVLVIDVVKQKVIKKISTRGKPWWLEVSPDGSEVMVTE